MVSFDFSFDIIDRILGLTDIGGEVELRSNQLCIRHRKLSLHLRLKDIVIRGSFTFRSQYLGLEGPICLSAADKSKE